GALAGGIVAELAEGALPPAVSGAIGHGAGVVATSRDGGDDFAGEDAGGGDGHRDGALAGGLVAESAADASTPAVGGGIAACGGGEGQRDGALAVGIVAELAEDASAPAVGGAIGDGAGVTATSRDGGDDFAGEDARGGDGHRDVTLAGGIIAELAAVASTPAVGGAIGHGAGVIDASRDASDGFAGKSASGVDGDGDAGVGGGVMAEAAAGAK